MFEHLEVRKQLSASLVDGTLFITGTDQADLVAFERAGEWGETFGLHLNGVYTAYSRADVKRIEIRTGAGDDTVILGRVNRPALVEGGAGNDSLSGGNRGDTLLGGEGDDYLFGRKGDDLLEGGPGRDLLMGGRDNDQLKPFSDGTGDDTVSGGPGRDTVDYSEVTTNLQITVGSELRADQVSDDVLVDVEILIGGRGNDQLSTASGKPIVIDGGPGDDTIRGGSGADTLIGGPGRDRIFGFGGIDTITAGDNEADEIDAADNDIFESLDLVDVVNLG